MQLIKYLTTIFIFLFSYSGLATNHIPFCDSSHTKERYNELQQLIKKDSNIDHIYHLAQVSFCLGEEEEGVAYLQKAADANHIVANFLLGIYYKNNHSFNPANAKSNTDSANWDKTINYYTKTAELIESLPNYPEESSEETKLMESTDHVSYWLFTQLPALYLDKYLFITVNSAPITNKEKVTDTLDVLNKVKESATQCLNRPALSIWQKDKEDIYKKQQMVCNALLNTVKMIYPLEQHRIQAGKNCIVPLNKCSEYNGTLHKILQLIIQFSPQMITQSVTPQSEI